MRELRNVYEASLKDVNGDVKEAQKRVVSKLAPDLESGKIPFERISLREAFDIFCDINHTVDLHNVQAVAEAIQGSQFPYFTDKVLVPVISKEYEFALGNALDLVTEETTTKQTVNVPGLGNFYGPTKVAAGEEYGHDTAEDNYCTIKMHKYGNIIDLTREAILADETGILRTRAAAAGRYMGRLVHEIIVKKIANITTAALNGEATNTAFVYAGTGYAHFSNDHSSIDGQTNDNLDATAFSHTEIVTLFKLLAGLKDDRGKVAPVVPKVLMVPAALWPAAMQLTGSEKQYDVTNNAINPWKGMFSVFTSPFWDANSAVLFYLGDPKSGVYLFWRMKPTTVIQNDNSHDAFHRDVVLAYRYASEFNVGILDYRCMAQGGA